MKAVTYLNGEFLPTDDARLPVTDVGLVRGYGVFDFTRTYNGRPFHLDAHVDRLFRSAEALLLDMPWSKADIIAVVHQTLAHRDPGESFVRIIVTGGDSSNSLMPDVGSRLIVTARPAVKHPAERYINGIPVITVEQPRYRPGVKSLNYVPAILAHKASTGRRCG